MVQTSDAGRRMVMATQPALVAGGMTIWTRSPVGSEADSSGRHSIDALLGGIGDQLRQALAPIEIRERQFFAAPARRVSRNASPGRLMHSSVTSLAQKRAQRAQRQGQRRDLGDRVNDAAAADLSSYTDLKSRSRATNT